MKIPKMILKRRLNRKKKLNRKYKNHKRTISMTTANEIVFITGAASGIGRALCLHMAGEKASIIAADIDSAGVKETADAINLSGGNAMGLILDVTDNRAFKRAVGKAVQKFGRIDILINNAAVCIAGDMRDISSSMTKKVMEVNFFGMINGTLAAYEIMLKQGKGRIVNISSMAGFAPYSINAPYTASKHAVLGFTRAFEPEAKARGVHVSLVCPGIVRTEFYDNSKIICASRESYNSHLPKRLINADRAAEIITKGIKKNKTMIIFPAHAKLAWYASRFAPGLFRLMNAYMVKKFEVMRRDKMKQERLTNGNARAI